MADFMSLHQIDMRHYENMVRYDQRFRKRRIEEIEQSRTLMEDKYDAQFTYT